MARSHDAPRASDGKLSERDPDLVMVDATQGIGGPDGSDGIDNKGD